MLSRKLQSGMAMVVMAVMAVTVSAGVINDGSTTSNLTLEHNDQTSPSMSSDGSVVTYGALDGYVRMAAMLHNDPVNMTEYSVSDQYTNASGGWWTRGGGVVGWFDTSTNQGIVLARGVNPDHIVLGVWDSSVPYSGWEPIKYGMVYDEAGTALTGAMDPGSLNLRIESPVTYKLEFVAVSASDLAINAAFTTKIIASIDDGTNAWSDTFYTTLAAPTSGNHAVGYWGNSTQDDPAVGTFDNLTLVPEPASMGLLAMGGLALLRRRRA